MQGFAGGGKHPVRFWEAQREIFRLTVAATWCPELEIRRQKRSMLAKMSSADLVQTNGLRSALLSFR